MKASSTGAWAVVRTEAPARHGDVGQKEVHHRRRPPQCRRGHLLFGSSRAPPRVWQTQGSARGWPRTRRRRCKYGPSATAVGWIGWWHQESDLKEAEVHAFGAGAHRADEGDYQVSSESTRSRSWVSDRAGFGCRMGMTYPYLARCGGVAGGMSPAPCPWADVGDSKFTDTSRRLAKSHLLNLSATNSTALPPPQLTKPCFG